MDKHFKKVVEFYKPIAKLTHQQDVMRLYRKALRTISSWAENRDVFNEAATEVRERFNKNQKITDQAEIRRIMRESKAELAEQLHPDPYLVNYMPGGTLFMRNPAIPYEVFYPDGLPEGMKTPRLNIDMSYIPEGQTYADKVFVDSATKSYWIDK